MIERALVLLIGRYIKGPARSWIYTSLGLMALRFLRSKIGSREVVELTASKPGDRIVIEHLGVDHKTQIRQLAAIAKRDRKAEKKLARAAKRDHKADKQVERVVKRNRKEEKKLARAAARDRKAARRATKRAEAAAAGESR